MISLIDLHQRLRAVFPYFMVLALLFSPGYTLLFMTIVIIGRKKQTVSSVLKVVYGVILIVDITIIFSDVVTATFNAVPTGILDWLFGLSSMRLLFPVCIALIYAFLGTSTSDQMLIKQEQRKRQNRLQHTSEIPFENRRHLFVAGTTGAGKTTFLLQYAENSIAAGEQLYIVSGKNGTDDPRSLLNMTKALAKKYNRELIIVSLNRREDDRECYNPLAEMTPTELSDVLVTISDYTEPHYKNCTAMWVNAICECLILANIPLSLNSVCDFYTFDDFRELVSRLLSAGKLTPSRADKYMGFDKIAAEAALSRSRYLNLLLGDGSDLFDEDEGFVNASIAKKENAIFFVDLDSFRYTDYTRSIGKLFISDIRHVISTETDVTSKKRVIMDELGSFATDQLIPLFSQARSYGYQVIVATQSIADLNSVSENFSEQILENCGQYAVLQLNSAQDAERMANIIGTCDSVETTRKSSGLRLDTSGAGTKKVVHEFKVSPDYIKELQPLHVVFYSKLSPETVSVIKVPFIEL